MLSERPGPAGERRRRVLGVSTVLVGVAQLAVAGFLITLPGSSPTLDPLTFPQEEGDGRTRGPVAALSPRPIATPRTAASRGPASEHDPTGGPTSGPAVPVPTVPANTVPVPTLPASTVPTNTEPASTGPTSTGPTPAGPERWTASPEEAASPGGSMRPGSEPEAARDGEPVPPRAARRAPREVSVHAPDTPPLVAGGHATRTPAPWRTRMPSGLVDGHPAETGYGYGPRS